MVRYGNTHNTPKGKDIRLHVLARSVFIIASCLFLSLQTQAAPLSAKILMEKGDSCRLVYKYKKALGFFQQAMQDPAVEKDSELQFQLLERIMRTHDVLRHWKEMPESSYRLLTLAKEKDDSVYMAKALFMRGKRMHMLGQREKGRLLCRKATEIMKRTNDAHKYHELADFYALLARMYVEDGQYDKALRMSEAQERYVRLSKKCHPEEWYRRNEQRVFTIRIGILAKMGKQTAADSLYQVFQPAMITDPMCGEALLEYFRLRGQYDKVLEFLNAAMKNIREDGDTIGRNMQRLQDDMGDIYYQLGDYKKAAECYAGVTVIADSLAVRSLNGLTIEVQRAMDSERHNARHNQILTIIIACVVLLAVVFLLLLRQTWVMRRRNRRMTELIRQLMHYRNLIIQNGDPVEMGENETSSVPKEQLQRFKEVDKRIMKERLFANPDFGREDLMRLLGVDKNTLPGLINSITGTNVPGYVNIKRMEYAVSLIKEHPEYTLGAIGEACGIKSSATFIRNFRAAYDMTPSEYRKLLEEASTTPPPC